MDAQVKGSKIAAAGIDSKNFFSATGVMIPVSRSEVGRLREALGLLARH